MKTLNEFIDQYNFEFQKHRQLVIYLYETIVSGVGFTDGPKTKDSYITKQDALDAIVESDCQFGYDENDKLVDPLGFYKVFSHTITELKGGSTSLNIYLHPRDDYDDPID